MAAASIAPLRAAATGGPPQPLQPSLPARLAATPRPAAADAVLPGCPVSQPPPLAPLPVTPAPPLSIVGTLFARLSRALAPAPVATPASAARPKTSVLLQREAGVDSTGTTPWLDVRVPAGTEGFLISAEGSADGTYGVVDIIDPFGRSIVQASDGTFAGLAQSPNRPDVAQGIATALVPNAPGIRATAGRWRFRVRGLDTASGAPLRAPLTVQVLATAADRERPVLRLHIHTTGQAMVTQQERGECRYAPWTAAEMAAGRNPDFAQVLAVVQRDLGAAGIDVVVDPVVRQLPPAFATIASLTGANNELDRLFAAGQTSEPGLNVFFVDGLSWRLGANLHALGVTTTVAIPPATARGRRLGVVVAADSPAQLGNSLAHEIGHALGLHHTRELNGGPTDPLPDTPNDSAGNLMGPVTSAKPETFSPQQAAVLRRSPLLLHR